MIAHRLSSITGAARMLVFSDGQIAEEDSFNELISEREILSLIWNDCISLADLKVKKEAK